MNMPNLALNRAGILRRLIAIGEMESWSLLSANWPLYGLVFLIGTENFIVSPFLPTIAREGNFAIEAAATLVTAYAITYALSAPMLGALSDRVGRRLLIILGGVVFLSGNLLVGSAYSLTGLQIARAVTGLGGAMAGPAIWAYMADNTAPALRGRAMGLGMGAFALGQVIGLPLGGLAAALAGWRWTFNGIGLLMLVLLAGIGLMFVNQKDPRRHEPAGNSWFSIFSIWRSGPIRLAFGVTFLFHAANLASYTFLGVLLSDYFQQGTGQISTIGIFVGFGSLCGSLFGGKAVDYWRARGGRCSQLVICWALLLGLTVFITTSPFALPVRMAALTLWFMASGAFVTTQQTLLTLAAPTMRATAVSWNNSIMYAGTGAGVWVIGMGLPHGIPVGAFGLCLGVGAAICAAFLARIETRLITERNA